MGLPGPASASFSATAPAANQGPTTGREVLRFAGIAESGATVDAGLVGSQSASGSEPAGGAAGAGVLRGILRGGWADSGAEVPGVGSGSEAGPRGPKWAVPAAGGRPESCIEVRLNGAGAETMGASPTRWQVGQIVSPVSGS